MAKPRKTFLSNITQNDGNIYIELTLIDSHYKTACVDSVEDILSCTLLYNDFLTYSEDDSNGLVLLKPSIQSSKVVSFYAKVPNQGIESIFIETRNKSIQLEF